MCTDNQIIKKHMRGEKSNHSACHVKQSADKPDTFDPYNAEQGDKADCRAYKGGNENV